ncbi:MAG: hypothetical protein U0R28_12445 [Candidatus Nanopelagicales bacterium]
MHQLPDGAVVDALGSRYERHSALTQIGHHDGVVDTIARHPGELVYDDEVDILLDADPLEHLLEGDPLSHLSAGTAWLHVLADDVQPHLFNLAQTGTALSWDGDSLGVIVGVDLAC